jgi:hypothetical protein
VIVPFEGEDDKVRSLDPSRRSSATEATAKPVRFTPSNLRHMTLCSPVHGQAEDIKRS